MDDRDREYLQTLIGHANAAIGYARAHGRTWWHNNETLDAVLMRVSQVGETATKVSPAGLSEVSGVTWRDVKGIRAKIAHDYQRIDVLIIRGVVSRQLPSLITRVRQALSADEKRKIRAMKAAEATAKKAAAAAAKKAAPGSQTRKRRPPAKRR